MTRKPGTADLTSLSGSATDVARVGRQSPTPRHEQTADEDSDPVDWERIAALDEFKALLAAKRRFIAPATVFFIAYYFALPVLVGYAPGLMTKKVFGVVNVAYLFALSQFFVAWAVAALYVRAAGGFDRMAQSLRARFEKAEVMSTSLAMFLGFIAITLWITWWAARRSAGSSAYFAAGRSLSAWQNGIAVAGDYMSAASFLGIAGIIAFQGYDGFMYSVGWLVAYLTVLLLVAEPLRNAGKYTMADVLAYRLSPRPVRAMGALSTLTVSTFYMIAQMVGAGALVSLLLRDAGIDYHTAVIGIGVLMIVYVVFGGMLATTWVQIVKAILLMGGTILLTFLVLLHFDFSLPAFFDAVGHVTYTDAQGATVTRDFMTPGLRYAPPYGALDLISLGMALIFGTAGLPHILVRFYTVPDARTARKSVVWAMFIIGGFYILTTFLGFGAATIVGRDFIAKNGGTNMSAPLLAQALAGDVFFAFISAIAFATILAVVAGLTISASTSFAHDFWTNVIHHGRERREGEEVRVARVAAFFVGAISILIAIVLGPNANVAFLVALAFAVAASANLPVIVLSLFWRRFNTAGAVCGLATGLVSSLALIVVSPSIMKAAALFPLENPGIVSIPLGFLGAVIGTLLRREPRAEQKFTELSVRANTGLGAERASAH